MEMRTKAEVNASAFRQEREQDRCNYDWLFAFKTAFWRMSQIDYTTNSLFRLRRPDVNIANRCKTCLLC